MANLELSKGERIGEKDFKGNYQGREIVIREMEFTKKNMEMVLLEVRNHQKCEKYSNNILIAYSYQVENNKISIALETWECSLLRAIWFCNQNGPHHLRSTNTEGATRFRCQDRFLTEHFSSSYLLWDWHGKATDLLIKIVKDMVRAVSHLHQEGIYHRNITPGSFYITYLKDNSIKVKLNDLGFALIWGTNPLVDPKIYAPEQYHPSLPYVGFENDLWHLGSSIAMVVTGGHKLFQSLNPPAYNNSTKTLLEKTSWEAACLVRELSRPDYVNRLPATASLRHPLFWDESHKIQFLNMANEEFQAKLSAGDWAFINDADSAKNRMLGIGGLWFPRLDVTIRDHLVNTLHFNAHRDGGKFLALLRVIRNYFEHFNTVSKPVQNLNPAILGTTGFQAVEYFTTLFPSLLMEVYYLAFSGHFSNSEIFSDFLEKIPL